MQQGNERGGINKNAKTVGIEDEKEGNDGKSKINRKRRKYRRKMKEKE